MKSLDIPPKLFLAVLSIALLAQVSFDVPWSETTIPISGQTFAVLVVGMLLGKRWGAIAVLLYLLAGGIGLPVFADGGSGWETFVKGSGGFLFGFVLGAFVVGWFAENGWDKSIGKCILAMFIGTLIIMTIGVAGLSFKYGLEKAMAYGFYPFIPGALMKVILGAVVVFLVKKWI